VKIDGFFWSGASLIAVLGDQPKGPKGFD